MTKVNGWVIHKRTGKIGVSHSRFTTLQLWVSGVRITPYFSTCEKLQSFGDMLQATGIPMENYEASFAEGLSDEGDLILDPDPFEIYPRVMSGLQ